MMNAKQYEHYRQIAEHIIQQRDELDTTVQSIEDQVMGIQEYAVVAD